MHRLRFAILGATAALALGTASAVAMQQGPTGGTDPDQHGDNVASAARSCPHGAGGVHGQCVSAVASSKSEGQENESQQEPRDAAVQACKAADKTEDTSEKKPAKGDKAAKAADKTEDKSERATFKACLQAAGVSTGSQ